MIFFKGLFTACMIAALPTLAHAIDVGDDFPKVKIAAYQNGGDISFEGLKGKVTIINFWATWCEACKVELKEMQTAFPALLKHADARVAYVTLDKEPAKAEDWVKAELNNARDFMSQLYKDPAFSAADVIKVDAFPMTLVIGKDAKVKHIQRGFKEGEGSTAKLVDQAKALLSGT